MTAAFSRKYEKQFDSITDAKIRRQVIAAVKSIIDSPRLDQIPSIKKLKGSRNAYRVRSGQYRIGLYLEENGTILIAALDTRKDFYRSFP